MASRVLLALIAKHDRFALDHRRQANRPLPNPKQATHDFLCIVLPQVGALMIVPQQELTSVVEVGVLDVNDRVSAVGQLEKKLLFDGAELPRFDFVSLVAIGPSEGKELVLLNEIRRQEFIDERDVVIKRANLEYFLSA
jgi:hypothetical protein